MNDIDCADCSEKNKCPLYVDDGLQCIFPTPEIKWWFINTSKDEKEDGK